MTVIDTTLDDAADDVGREVTIALRPISTDEWMKLSPREQQLSAISDVVAYWIAWTTGERTAESLTTMADTHVMLAGENAPPHWPSIGQLVRWVEVLRDSDASLAEDPKGLSGEAVAARAEDNIGNADVIEGIAQ